MRRSREDTAATRKRIVHTASRLFRARGIAAVSVADVMSAVGLTVGGFYRHFESKDALVAEAIESASLETTGKSAAAARAVDAQPGALIEAYVSQAHRDHPGTGCPVAALCADVAHEGRATRRTFTAALRRLLDTVALAVPGESDAAREQRLFIAAAAVGSLVLSRATEDAALADAILAATRRTLANAARARAQPSTSMTRAT